MAWYDRDYYRTPYGGSGFGALAGWSVTTWLIVINVAVFVLDRLLAPSFGGLLLATWGYFSFAAAIEHLQIWRFLTFQFLHAGLGHLLFNMLALYFFGPMIEQYLGSRRYLAFYLLCGVAGAVLYMLLLATHILVGRPDIPLVGASAGIFGILIAAARVAPDTTVMLLFPPIPMRLKTLAWVLLGIALFTILFSGPNAGGQAAHLGGAALGYVLIQNPRALNVFDFAWHRRLPRRNRSRQHDYYR